MELKELNGKLKVLLENGCFGVPWGARGAALVGEMVTGGDNFGAMGQLWWVLGCLWGALGATLGAKKATREAPRRVTGPFGGPKGLWEGPGVILGVVLGSKKIHFEVSKP